MLMTVVHMDSTHGHGPSSSSATSPPPWLPPNHHLLLHDFPTSSAPTPSAPPPATAAAPSRHHPFRSAPSSRRAAKRRPRPSRRLPTTYIRADPASFRRMVHQVTGAEGLPFPPPSEALHRQAPARASSAGAGALVLPTLDTSAFLIGTRTGTNAAALEAEAGAPGGSSGNGGFPTLESWDAALF
ncbi:calmodulin-binding protein 25-like [Phragmites australis]|uniref:calmodulin-binding protein 25-like n=1 Tax=Phragmites australis TaxID=29695 RepID=UPI002D779C79|nr:calmodulin-binding protein 25-like [Phragmites australis]